MEDVCNVGQVCARVKGYYQRHDWSLGENMKEWDQAKESGVMEKEGDENLMRAHRGGR